MPDETCIHGLDQVTCTLCKPKRHAANVRSNTSVPSRYRVATTRRNTHAGPAWHLDRELRSWQNEAIASWNEQRRRGVIEAATGTGKTVVALKAIELLREDYGAELRVAIIVPTIALAKQWRVELRDKLGIPNHLIGEIHSDVEIAFDRRRHEVLIITVNSGRDRLAPIVQRWNATGRAPFMIVDECHRTGSEQNRRVYGEEAKCAMGLSATPTRDDGLELPNIYPAIGMPCYTYQLSRALDDGVVSPLLAINLYVDFEADEQQAWDELATGLSKAIGQFLARHPDLDLLDDGGLFNAIKAHSKDGDSDAAKIVGLIAQRRQLMSMAANRLACTRHLLDWLRDAGLKALVFHEAIGAAQRTFAELEELELSVAIDHSQLRRRERTHNLDRFRNGEAQVMSVVRALDEGIDVPEAEVAIIASGSRSVRQRIQRIGRVLRQADNKEAKVVTVLVRGTPEEPFVGARDDGLLGRERVRHHRWPATTIGEAVEGQTNSYTPESSVLNTEPRTEFSSLVSNMMLRELGMATTRPKQPSWDTRTNGDDSDELDPSAAFSINVMYEAEQVRIALNIAPEQFSRIKRSVTLGRDKDGRISGEQVRRIWARRHD